MECWLLSAGNTLGSALEKVKRTAETRLSETPRAARNLP